MSTYLTITDSECSRLGICVDESSDVTLFDGDEPLTGKRWRFCTASGGGQALETRWALLHLMEAMKVDIDNNPRLGDVKACEVE